MDGPDPDIGIVTVCGDVNARQINPRGVPAAVIVDINALLLQLGIDLGLNRFVDIIDLDVAVSAACSIGVSLGTDLGRLCCERRLRL